MSQGNEMEELSSRMSGVVAAVIQASTQLAMALFELRIQRLREAAREGEEQVQAAREQARLFHQADSAVWRAAMRPQWWRDAGAEDISRVWRAASTWQHVDPRAAEARRVVVDRLAERGVRIDPDDQNRPSPDDVRWLSDALDRAEAARAMARAAGAGAPRPGKGERADRGETVEAATVIDGEFRTGAGPTAADAEAAEEARRHAVWEQKVQAYVRAAWSPERADRVIGCDAWGALVHELGGLEDRGQDVEVLLRGVPNFVDEAHTPAAFAVRTIRDRVSDTVDLDAGRRGGLLEAEVAAERAAARGQRADERDDRSEQRWAERTDTDPPEVGEVRARQAKQEADLHADRAAAHEARAAQVAAQGFPVSTKDAVTAVAEKTDAGAVTAAAKGRGGPRPASLRPGQQRNRPEPKGR